MQTESKEHHFEQNYLDYQERLLGKLRHTTYNQTG